MSRTAKPKRSPRPPGLARVLAATASWLPGAASRAGFAAVLLAAEPGLPKTAVRRRGARPTLRLHATRADAAAVGRLTAAQTRSLVRLLNGLANTHRLGIIRELLRGPVTYESLAAATKLRGGPLYHHVAQLRLAGLVAPRERNRYRLTRAGRTLVTVLLAVLPLARDSRSSRS